MNQTVSKLYEINRELKACIEGWNGNHYPCSREEDLAIAISVGVIQENLDWFKSNLKRFKNIDVPKTPKESGREY